MHCEPCALEDVRHRGPAGAVVHRRMPNGVDELSTRLNARPTSATTAFQRWTAPIHNAVQGTVNDFGLTGEGWHRSC